MERGVFCPSPTVCKIIQASGGGDGGDKEKKNLLGWSDEAKSFEMCVCSIFLVVSEYRKRDWS